MPHPLCILLVGALLLTFAAGIKDATLSFSTARTRALIEFAVGEGEEDRSVSLSLEITSGLTLQKEVSCTLSDSSAAPIDIPCSVSAGTLTASVDLADVASGQGVLAVRFDHTPVLFPDPQTVKATLSQDSVLVATFTDVPLQLTETLTSPTATAELFEAADGTSAFVVSLTELGGGVENDTFVVTDVVLSNPLLPSSTWAPANCAWVASSSHFLPSLLAPAAGGSSLGPSALVSLQKPSVVGAIAPGRVVCAEVAGLNALQFTDGFSPLTVTLLRRSADGTPQSQLVMTVPLPEPVPAPTSVTVITRVSTASPLSEPLAGVAADLLSGPLPHLLSLGGSVTVGTLFAQSYAALPGLSTPQSLSAALTLALGDGGDGPGAVTATTEQHPAGEYRCETGASSSGPQEGCLSLCRAAGVCTLLPSSEGSGQEAASTNSCAYSLKPAADSTGCTHKWGCGSAASPRPCTSAHLRCGPRSSAVCGPQTWVLDVLCVETAAEKEVAHSRCAPFPAPTLPEGHGVGDACEVSEGCEHRCRPEAGHGPAFECADSRSWACTGSSQDTPPLEGASRRFLTLGEEEDTCGLACSSRARSVFCVDPSSGSEVSASLCTAPAPANTADQGAFGSCSQAALGTLTLEWQRGGSGDVDALAVAWSGGTNIAPQPHTMLVHIIPPSAAAALFPNPGPLVCTDPASGATIACSGPSADGVLTVSLPSLAPAGSLTIALPRSAAGAGHVRGVKAVATVAVAESAAAAAAAAGDESLTGDFAVASAVGDVGIVPLDESESDAWFVPASSKGASDALLGTLTVALSGTGMLASAGGADIHAVSVTLPPGWSLDDATSSAECRFSCGESAPLWPFTAPWEVTADVVFIPRVLTASFTSSVPAAGCVSLFLACTGLVAPVQDAGIPISLEFDAGSLLHVVPQVLVQQVSLAAAPALLAVVIDDQDSAFTLADVMGSFASESVSTALATGVLISPGPSARALLTLVSAPGLAALSPALAPVTIEDARVRAQAERACRFPDSAAALLSSQASPGGSAIWLACDSGCGEPVRDVCRLGGQTADPSDVDMCALEPAPPAAPAPCAPTVTSGGVSFGDDVLTVTYATNGDFFGPTALVWAVEGLAEVAELDSLPECPADPSVPCQAAGLVLVPTTGDTLHAGAPVVVPLPVARAARRLPVALSLRGSGNGSVLWTWQGVVDVNVREITADALRFVWQEEGTLIALLTLPEDDGGLLIDTIQVTPPSGVSLSLSPSSPATVCSIPASEAATTPFWPWSASLVSAHTTAADTVTTLSELVPVSGRLLAIVLTGAQIDANPAPQSEAALFLVASANKTVGYAVTHTVDAPVSEPAPPSPGVLSLLFTATNPSLPSVEAAAAAIGAPASSIAVAPHSSGLTVAVDVPASLSWATAIASPAVLSSGLSGVALSDAEFDPSGTALLPYGAWSCPGSNLPASGGSACPTRVDGDCGGFLPELAECVSEDAQASAVQCAFVPRPAVETAGCAPKVLSFSFTSIAPLSVSGGIAAPPAGMGSYALTFGYTSSEREHFLVAPEGLALRLHLPASLSTPAGVALAGCANGNGHALVCDVSEEDDVVVVTVRVPNSRRDGVITLPLAARGASSVSLAVAAAPNSPVAYSGPSAVVLGDLLYASVPAALFSAQLVPVGAAVEGDQPTTGTLSLVAGSDTLLALPPLETFFADSFTHVHVFLSSAMLGTPARCFATAAATSSPSSPLAAWPLSAASLFRTNGPDTVTTGGSLSARLPLALSDGATMVTLLCAGLPLLPSAAHASGDVVLELIDSASGHVLRLSPPSASLTYDPLAAPPRAQVLLAGFTADPAPADPATVAAALESAVVGDAASEVEVLVDVSEAGEVSVAVKTKDDAWGLVDALVLLNGTHSVLSLLEAEFSSIASTAASAATTVTLVPDSVLSGLEGALLCADAAAPHSFAVCAVPGDCGHEYQGPVRCVDTAAAAGESPAQGAAGVDARWCSFLPPVPPAPVVIDRCEPTFALISASFIEGDRPEEDGMLELGVVVSDASQFVGVRAYEIVLVDTKNVFSFANISCNATSFDSPDDDDDDGLLVQGQSCSSSGNELRVSLTNLAGDVTVQVTGVGVTAWSRKAILSATATVDADDSNIFVGDPAVVVGPVGVSSFTAPSALAEFVATNASHSNEGALLVSLVVHGGFLLNDSVTTAHITLPPGWTVTGCSVAACAPGPQHWPFSLTSPITMANTELKGDVYSVGLPSNWHGPGSIWVLCDMVTPSAESKGAVSVALSKKTRLYDHSASLPIESKPAAATDIDSYVSFVLKTSVEVAIVSPEALSKAAGVGAISRSVGSYKLRITMRLKGLNRVFRLVLMVPEVIEGFLAAASTRDGLAALSGELESNPPPQRGHIGSWLCGAQAGSSSTFGSCVVSNLCGTQFNTTLHCVVNDVNTSPYSADEVACSFDSKPVPVSKSGCGSFKCRDPLGDLVDCNHESICHHDCSVSPFPITTADHSSSPFAQYCIKNGVDANPAEFCPADLISPAPYASTCVPRTACAWSCFDSQNKTVPCANDAAWGPCSSTCGPGTRTRNLACSAPNPEVGVALEVLDAGMCAFTALTIPKQEDCSSSSCVDHSHKWLCAAPGAGSGSNTFLGDMYDSCDVPGGMWSDCSVICGSGRQSRTVKCALVGKDNKIGNTSEPPENCGSKDTPASTKTCLIEQCPGAEWRCAMGGNTATPCGDWPVCPSTGCGIKVQHRDVGCYVDTSLVHEGNCTLSKPDSRHVCGRLTDACVADFTGSTCTYDKMGQITSTLDGICVSSGDDAYRLGKCVNAAGRDVDDDLCGQETLLQKCNLPPCTSIRYVWGTGPEACGSKKGFCETFIPRSVKCYAVAPGWPTVTVNDGHCAAGQKPAPVAACATMPCLSGGTCEAKSVVYMDVEYPNILEGKCKCPLGTGGSFCETALVLQNVKVSVAAPNYRITWTLNTNTINVPAVVELSSTSLDVPLMLGSVNVTMLSFSIPILDVADIITPGLHNFTVTIPTSRVSAAFEHVPPCNTAALSCANGGRCDSKTGRCKCLGDFQGRTCNDKPCDRKGCNLDGSTCDDSTGTAICSCSRGPNGAELLMGELCDTPVNGCPDAGPTCLNGGKRAVSVVASEVVCGDCKCKANFAGPSCGSCRLNCERGSPDSTCSRCLCPAGYQGKSCECRYALMRFLLVTSGDLEWLPNAGSSPSASVWALNVQRALVSRLGADATTDDVLVEINDSKFVTNSSGVGHVEVTVRFDGPCGLGQSMEDVHKAMNLIKDAFLRGDLAREPAFLGLVAEAGVGLDDPNCQPSILECPSNVGRGGVIAADNSTSPGGDSGSNGPDPKPPKGKDDDDDSPSVGIVIAIVIGIAVVVTIAVVAIAWKMGVFCFKPGTPATFAPGQKGRSYYDV